MIYLLSFYFGNFLFNISWSVWQLSSYYEKFLATGEVKCIDDEIPFEIPQGWEWIRLQMVAEVARGGSPRPIKEYLTESANGVNWIKIGDTEKGGKYINGTREKIKQEGVSKSRMIGKGDFLLTNSMSFGRPYISNIDGCIHDGWLVISAAIGSYTQDFLFYLLSSHFAYYQFSGKVSGAVVQNLNKDKVAEAIFPIPPYAEQKRIVSFLEKIMPLVEKYGSVQEEAALLNTTILDKLKKSILQEAIQGKLDTQNPEDEPASLLLQRIRDDKLRLVKEGKLKKKDIVDSVIFKGDDNKYFEKKGKDVVCIDDEIPFEIPPTWEWTRLSYIAEIYTGNSISETEKKSKFTDISGRYYVGTKDIGFDNKVRYNNDVAIPAKYERDFKIAHKGSVLMCIEGGSAGRKIALLNQDVCFGNKLCCFAPFMPIEKFLFYYLQSPTYLETFNGNKTGIIGGVSIAKIKTILIPLPPQQEIERIVNIIDKFVASIMSK